MGRADHPARKDPMKTFYIPSEMQAFFESAVQTLDDKTTTIRPYLVIESDNPAIIALAQSLAGKKTARTTRAKQASPDGKCVVCGNPLPDNRVHDDTCGRSCAMKKSIDDRRKAREAKAAQADQPPAGHSPTVIADDSVDGVVRMIQRNGAIGGRKF